MGLIDYKISSLQKMSVLKILIECEFFFVELFKYENYYFCEFLFRYFKQVIYISRQELFYIFLVEIYSRIQNMFSKCLSICILRFIIFRQEEDEMIFIGFFILVYLVFLLYDILEIVWLFLVILNIVRELK